MTTSDSLNELAAALAKAQGEMKNAVLNKVNPHFKNRYADLAAIRDAVIPPLTKHGIAVVQALDASSVLTRLVHTSGQWIESVCPIPNGGDMQKMGSAITYARRYSLSAICGIAADEDDDANAASTPASGPKAIVKVPEGFEAFALDLEAVASEGSEALKAAWTKANPALRKHLTDTAPAKWETLKAKAARTVAVSA